jgi:signal recognition particle subunit SRP54
MDSMTDDELENPRVVGKERTVRIARGAGVEEDVIRELLEQHRAMEQTLKQFQGMGDGDLQRMMRKMGDQGGGMGGMGGGGPFG